MRCFTALALGIVASLGLATSTTFADDSGASGASGGGELPTITEIVASSGGEFDDNNRDYDILFNVVVALDLAETLADPDINWTVFAPNDKAFKRLANDLGLDGSTEESAFTGLAGLPTDLLTSVVLYHVAPDNINAIEFILFGLFGIPIETLNPDGATFQPSFFSLIDNEPDLRNPRLTFPINVRASNGIIHTINRVLIPVDLP